MILPPRKWQKDQVAEFVSAKHPDLWLTCAGTGTGKTHATGYLIKECLNRNPDALIVVCCPLRDVKNGWMETLDADKTGVGFRLPATDEILELTPTTAVFVTTYAGLGGHNGAVSMTCRTSDVKDRPIILVLDEIHRLEEDSKTGETKGWSDNVVSFRNTHNVIHTFCLTATPWKEGTGCKLPFVEYRGDGTVVAQYAHTYGEELLRDPSGVVKISFRGFHASYIKGHGANAKVCNTAEMNEYDPLKNNIQFGIGAIVSTRMYKDLNSEKPYIREMVNEAVNELRIKRGSMGKCKGLVICESIESAKMITEYMQILEPSTVRVDSKMRGVVNILDQFKVNDAAWIVSVGMLGEGVNIPRVKVLIDLSNVLTKRDIIQRWGRTLRACSDVAGIEAKVYYFRHAMLDYLATHMKREVKAAIKNKREHEAREETENAGIGDTVAVPIECHTHAGNSDGAVASDISYKEKVAMLADWMLSVEYEGLVNYTECLRFAKIVYSGYDNGTNPLPGGFVKVKSEPEVETDIYTSKKKRDSDSKKLVIDMHSKLAMLRYPMCDIGDAKKQLNGKLKYQLVARNYVPGTQSYKNARGELIRQWLANATRGQGNDNT